MLDVEANTVVEVKVLFVISTVKRKANAISFAIEVHVPGVACSAVNRVVFAVARNCVEELTRRAETRWRADALAFVQVVDLAFCTSFW